MGVLLAMVPTVSGWVIALLVGVVPVGVLGLMIAVVLMSQDREDVKGYDDEDFI